MRRASFLLAAALASCAVARASVLRIDVSRDALYLHPSDLHEDGNVLAKELATERDIILDLRGTKGRKDDAAALAAGFEKPGKPSAAVHLVLLNHDTATSLLDVFANEVGDTVTLGPATANATCDVAIDTSVELDREAAKAIAGGADFHKWTVETVVKERFDEASLVAAKNNPTATETSVPDKAPASTPPAEKPKLDHVLSRALQLLEANKVYRK